MKKFKPGQLLRLKNRWKHAESYSSERIDSVWMQDDNEPVIIGLKPFLMIEEEEEESEFPRVVVLYEERFYAFLQDAVVQWKSK